MEGKENTPIQVLQNSRRQELEQFSEFLSIRDVKSKNNRDIAKSIWHKISYYGSNSFAYVLRGKKGVGYSDIARDVAKQIGIKNTEFLQDAKECERKIIEHLIGQAWNRLSNEEKEVILKMAKFPSKFQGKIAAGGSAVAIGKMMGSYTISQATWWSGAFAGSMSAAAIPPSMVTISTLAPVVGWVIGGIWLAHSFVGPAYRKTVKSVLWIACLREFQSARAGIGVVGLKSVGKDSCIRSVFGITETEINPHAGSTTETVIFPLDGLRKEVTNVRIANFPGFNDLRNSVKDDILRIDEYDFFIHVIDITRGIDEDDQKIRSYLKKGQKKAVIAFNKTDIYKGNDNEMQNSIEKYRKELGGIGKENCFLTAFDPMVAINNMNLNQTDLLRERLVEIIGNSGKNPDPFFSHWNYVNQEITDLPVS